ncbi:MAG: NAD-dependent epimerase/dehydratase family protein [Selenomonadaceae bacterium]|nr:NAD-dependent epimerase/dehydratase family protein [Selenomonadaceae bacterium]
MISKQFALDLEYTFSSLSAAEREKFSGSTVLITGAAGTMGFYLTHFFYKFRDALRLKKVICLDNFILGKPAWIENISDDPHVTFDKFDIISDSIENIPAAADANFVLHMASIASPPFYRKFPIETIDANVTGLRRLFDFYRVKNLRGFVFFSTSEIYGDPPADKVPTDENYNGNVSCTGPRACYDESKRFGETLCKYFAQEFNLPISVVRLFNTYGPGMKINDKRVVADFASNILHGEDITILSSGAPTRTFCHIADSAFGCLKTLLHGRYDFFNIGIDKPEISITRLAEIYRDAGRGIFNYAGKINYSVSADKDYLTDNPQRRCPNVDKARKILGYNPTIYVEEGVARFLNFVKENPKENLQW